MKTLFNRAKTASSSPSLVLPSRDYLGKRLKLRGCVLHEACRYPPALADSIIREYDDDTHVLSWDQIWKKWKNLYHEKSKFLEVRENAQIEKTTDR